MNDDQAIRALRAAGCVFAEDEAAVFRSAATDDSAFAEMVRRRTLGEPVEQVVGFADFAGVRVRVRPGVFVPRVRSELLVREAARRATGRAVVIDLCCGSGALGLAVRHRRPAITLYATDLDPVAVACARDNLAGTGAHVFEGDLYAALPRSLVADIVLANVPYVATADLPLLPAEARDHEPRTALDGGGDGLDVFRAVLAGAPGRLAPGGVLLSEITQAQADAAVAAVTDVGLGPQLISDEDLGATVIAAVR